MQGVGVQRGVQALAVRPGPPSGAFGETRGMHGLGLRSSGVASSLAGGALLTWARATPGAPGQGP